METIKNTVSHVLGTTKSNEEDAATPSTLGHHATSSTTTDTTGHGPGPTTGATDAANGAAPSDQNQTTGASGSTLADGATGTSTTGTSDLGSGRDTAVTSGATDPGRDPSEASSAKGVVHGTSDTGSTTHDTKSDNLSPGRSHPDRSEVQSPNQGPDPALVGDAKEHPKMVGQGAPGSHSAVFGLTPDGKKYDDSTHGATPIRPAHSDETTLGRKSVAGANDADSGGDTVSGGRGGVSDQIDAPDVGKKGLERTDPAPTEASNSGGKPGAGLTGLGQT